MVAWAVPMRRCLAAEAVSDFASIVHSLVLDVRDSYRPGLHYMRGPGPKWRAKQQSIKFRMTPAEPNSERRSPIRKSYDVDRADPLAKNTD